MKKDVVMDRLLDVMNKLLRKKLGEIIKENEQLKEKLLRANKLLMFCIEESNKIDLTRERENERSWNTDMGR